MKYCEECFFKLLNKKYSFLCWRHFSTIPHLDLIELMIWEQNRKVSILEYVGCFAYWVRNNMYLSFYNLHYLLKQSAGKYHCNLSKAVLGKN